MLFFGAFVIQTPLCLFLHFKILRSVKTPAVSILCLEFNIHAVFSITRAIIT